ncbi:glycosyltransferase family 4 protein [Capnocytophaga cynodegmi]|uniref:glycosyltransferase family 4 protein n=1 Tax=Capnocytophaga cynodegmi TaxID=28189 RepID=UPI00385ACF93
MNIKIAYIIPSLKNQGPIIVVRDIILGLLERVSCIDVYYFDEEIELDFPCKTHKISIFEKIDFDKYDIIHSHMLRPDFYVWYHRKKNHKSKFVSTLHQIIYDNLKGNYNNLIAFIFEKIWMILLSKQDYIVYLSQSMANTYKNKIKQKSVIIYNGRNISKEAISEIVEEHNELLRLKEKFKIVGTHCLLTKRKGINQSILALKQLPDYFLIVVGDGMEMQNLKNFAKSEGVHDRCLFLGYKKNSISYLKYFDIYLATSYSEGFSLSVIEAGECKLPIVCSNIESFKESYSENEVVFYTIDNIDSLVCAIRNAYKNKEIYSVNIFNKITTKYSVENMSNKYLELYKK